MSDLQQLVALPCRENLAAHAFLARLALRPRERDLCDLNDDRPDGSALARFLPAAGLWVAIESHAPLRVAAVAVELLRAAGDAGAHMRSNLKRRKKMAVVFEQVEAFAADRASLEPGDGRPVRAAQLSLA